MIVAEILNTVRGSFSIYIVSLNHVSSSLSHKRRISVLFNKYTKIYNEDQQLMLRMQRFNGNNYFTGYPNEILSSSQILYFELFQT